MSDQEQAIATPRVAAGVIFTDDRSRVLMLRTTYKEAWDIPGGYVEPGESPRAAAARELREELGVDVVPGALMAVDWAPSASEGDKILFLFEGPDLPPGVVFRFVDGEIAEARYVALEDLEGITVSRLARRVRSAIQASTTTYLEHGEPTDT